MKNTFLICEICNYKTNKRSNYNYHLTSKKHKNNTYLNDTDFKHICQICNYKTNIKGSFIMHLETNKHKQLELNKNNIDDNNTDINNVNFSDIENDTNEKPIDDTINDIEFESHIDEKFNEMINTDNNENDVTQLTKLVSTLVEQNTVLVENNNTLVKIISDTSSSTNINTQNNIQQQNNSFNLNFFLNETCKDAMSIDEFIDSIEVTVQDLKYLAKKGYVEGFSNLFIKHLEELDITKRPLHCSDIKREIIHIRDKKNWEKDNDQKMRLTGIATDISRLNTIALQGKYQEQYPHCLKDSKSKEHNEYGKIAYEAFGGKLDLDTANKKFFRNLLKVVAIDKANYK